MRLFVAFVTRNCVTRAEFELSISQNLYSKIFVYGDLWEKYIFFTPIIHLAAVMRQTIAHH